MIAGADSVLTFPERLVFLALLLVVTGLALRTYYRRFSLIRLGRSAATPEEGSGRLKRFLLYVPGQWSNLRTISWQDLGGAQHLVLFWSAIVFALYYLVFLILGEGVGVLAHARETLFARIFLPTTEILGLLILVALGWGLARRLWMKPPRLGPDYEGSLFLVITVAAYALLGSFFSLEGLRLTLGISSYPGPVSGLLAQWFQGLPGGMETAGWLFHGLWWLQIGVILCFIVYVPYSDHQHAVFAPFNILASTAQPKGRIAKAEMNESFRGLAELDGFTWKQLLDLYGCAQCGRCQDACPARAAGKALSPKKVIQDLRLWMDEKGKIRPFWKGGDEVGRGEPADRIGDDEVWSCTTCMACVQVCPALVSPLDKIVELRRDRVLSKSRFFPEVSNLFRDLENFGDIFGKGRATREDWAIGRNIKVLAEDNAADTLFWVGCQASFDDRTRNNAVKLAEILTRCGIDLAILGTGELCCGDPFRRLGNEYQFQNFARKNIDYLKKRRFKRIVTYCPHCFNSLKNEYPQFGGDFEVVHYTELFADLLRRGVLSPKKSASSKVVYHDPCYLARGNDVAKGHEILGALPGVTALAVENSGKKTFCCGGGGGTMWMRETEGAKINELRVRQLVQDGPEVIATSCPYCVVMLDDGIKSLGLENVKCKDLVEVVGEMV